MAKFRHFSRGMLSALCNNPANNKPIKGSRSATWQPKGDQRAQLYSHTSRTQRPFSAPRFPRISRVNGSHSKYEEEEGKRGREGWEREREKKKLANIHRSSSRSKKREARERERDGKTGDRKPRAKSIPVLFFRAGSRIPVALQSCHTRGRELNKFPEDVGSRGWRGEKAGEGRMSAGKNETRSSSGKVVPAKQKTSPSPSSSCSPRA